MQYYKCLIKLNISIYSNDMVSKYGSNSDFSSNIIIIIKLIAILGIARNCCYNIA